MAKVILGILIDKTHPQHIDINELSESDNGDQFAHALANIMPSAVLSSISTIDDDGDSIDRHTNYLRLIIKYAKSTN